jgi:hypothetical protein
MPSRVSIQSGSPERTTYFLSGYFCLFYHFNGLWSTLATLAPPPITRRFIADRSCGDDYERRRRLKGFDRDNRPLK